MFGVSSTPAAHAAQVCEDVDRQRQSFRSAALRQALHPPPNRVRYLTEHASTRASASSAFRSAFAVSLAPPGATTGMSVSTASASSLEARMIFRKHNPAILVAIVIGNRQAECLMRWRPFC